MCKYRACELLYCMHTCIILHVHMHHLHAHMHHPACTYASYCIRTQQKKMHPYTHLKTLNHHHTTHRHPRDGRQFLNNRWCIGAPIHKQIIMPHTNQPVIGNPMTNLPWVVCSGNTKRNLGSGGIDACDIPSNVSCGKGCC